MPDICELCFACDAVGTFDLDGVETLLCGGCSYLRRISDGALPAVVIPNEPI